MNKSLSQHPGGQARRDDHIDTLRGLACFLLVIYHVIGHSSTAGMELPDGHPLRLFADGLGAVRMPLFTVLSGWVYAWRPITDPQAIPGFMQGKIRRLLIPLFIVGGANAILMAIAATGGFDLTFLGLPFKALVIPHSVYWFLNALFLVFALIAVLETAGAMEKFRNWAILFAIVCALHGLILVLPTVFGLGSAVYLLPFFLLGLGLNRFHAILLDKRLTWIVVIAALIFLAAYNVRVHTRPAEPLGLIDVYGRLITGTFCTTALLMVAPRWAPLAWIGASSYAIYLFHVFGVAGGRALSYTLVPAGGLPLAFVGSLFAGIAGPLVVEAIAKRFTLTRTALLGLRFKKSA